MNQPSGLKGLIFNSNILGSLICQFVGLALYDTGVAVMSDVLLYVLDPTRRSFGQGIFFMVQSLFGEAPSPYIIGVLAQHMKPRILETHPQFQVLRIIFVMPLVDPSFHDRLVEVATPSVVYYGCRLPEMERGDQLAFPEI